MSDTEKIAPRWRRVRTAAAERTAIPLVLALGVILGAAFRGLVLCTAFRLGARFASPAWEVATNTATALLMLYFAVQLVRRMAV